MSITSVIVLAIIIVLSVAAIFLAEEPLDSIAEIEAAILGIGIKPLATKLHFNRHDAIARPTAGTSGWQAPPSMSSSPSGAITPELD